MTPEEMDALTEKITRKLAEATAALVVRNLTAMLVEGLGYSMEKKSPSEQGRVTP
jgi:hypothetical protein